jgi:hypothetical protein
MIFARMARYRSTNTDVFSADAASRRGWVVIDSATRKRVAAVETARDDLFYDAVDSHFCMIGGQGFFRTSSSRRIRTMTCMRLICRRFRGRVPEGMCGWDRRLVAVPHRGGQKDRVLVFDTK